MALRSVTSIEDSSADGPMKVGRSSTPEDLLTQGLNSAQDVSVKVVSCREVVQECVDRGGLSATAGRALGELVVCSLVMGSSLKGDETLQVNII